MTLRRRAGAPRLIEWTGERCVPWAPDVQVVYEHLHRYLWAAELVSGRDVLDLASGEGFGSAILAGNAASVVGIDVDELTIDHSRLNYAGESVDFQVGDARDLSRFQDDSFGALVAFEMIEHVDDQQTVLDEIARVLKPDGLLIMSTPDRGAYAKGTGQSNPFHVHELNREELTQLLEGKFENAAIWGQRAITGSALEALEQLPGSRPFARTFFIEREGDQWGLAAGLSPVYLVAVASNVALPAIPADSTLADCGLALMRAAEAATATAAEEHRRELQATSTRSAEEIQRRSAEQRELSMRFSEEIQRRDVEQRELSRTVSDRDLELDFRQRQIAELRTHAREDGQTILELNHTILELESELVESKRHTARIEQSVSWLIFDRIRRSLLAAMGGETSIPARIVKRSLREVGRLRPPPAPVFAVAPAPAKEPVIEMPQFPDPLVSIVIPLYSGAGLTTACLKSIVEHTKRVGYEVILVDDCADQETKTLLQSVHGARMLVNEKNRGYLRSVNLGAAEARGQWIVLCNNDIEARDGWLSAMLTCAQSSSDIAVVTPKYLYPDGSLSEAGAIIWRDATGANYGRGGNPGDCQYEFRREVDYGSAAALLVRADFWRDVGGFDERYLPMYYEDTDLCFQARERGLRVIYEPRANVVHVEGGTAGTDVSTGYKRYQEINRAKFVEKWRHRLEADQLRPSGRNMRRASDRRRGLHVLIVDHRVPMWDRDSGSLRMRGMIRALVDLGCRVTFFPDDRHLALPYTLELMEMGVEVWYGDTDILAELAAIGPGLALVITCRPHTTSRWLDLIRECAPSVPIVYDTVDLHWLREARRATLTDGSEQVALGPRAAVLREIELALIRATDVTLVVTAEERAQVEADVPQAVVRVVPNVNELRASVPPADGRQGVIFIGGFEHTPNVDAALRLVRRVMPRVWREIGQVPVTIIGGSVPPEVEALGSPLVDVAGWVRDVDPLFDAARAMVAPLSYGAGLKGKVTQALAAGLPVVTTAIGAEGLDASDGDQLLIADDDQELAERVIRVLTDADLWTALSRGGQKLAEARCSPAVMVRAIDEILKAGPSLRSGQLSQLSAR